MHTPNAQQSNGRAQWQNALDIAASLAVFVAVATFLWQTLRTPTNTQRPTPIQIPQEVQHLEGAQLIGERTARIAIIAYSEFQCPYCARFARDTLPELDKRYLSTGRVLFAFRNLPLVRLHPSALPAAEAAECAGEQTRFWDMHDALFRRQSELATLDFVSLAGQVGLDEETFKRCVKNGRRIKIQGDVETAMKLGIGGTPTFLIGRIVDGGVRVTSVLSGAQVIDAFAKVLDNLLIGLTSN